MGERSKPSSYVATLRLAPRPLRISLRPSPDRIDRSDTAHRGLSSSSRRPCRPCHGTARRLFPISVALGPTTDVHSPSGTTPAPHRATYELANHPPQPAPPESWPGFRQLRRASARPDNVDPPAFA